MTGGGRNRGSGHSPPAAVTRGGGGDRDYRGGGGGGGRSGPNSGPRDPRDVDWGSRYFRDEHEYYDGGDKSWDRGGPRNQQGGGPAGPRQQSTKQQPPKQMLPPRFLKAREQQQQHYQRNSPEEFGNRRDSAKERSWGRDEFYYGGGGGGGRRGDSMPPARSLSPAPPANKADRDATYKYHTVSQQHTDPADSRETRAASESNATTSMEPRISDWSLEVEEEEERIQEQQKQKQQQGRRGQDGQRGGSGGGGGGGGIIRLPPPTSTGDGNMNPAWRGTPPWQQQQQQSQSSHQMHGQRQQPPSNQRVLFDPKHPDKPIPNRAGHMGEGMQHGGMGGMARFPVDPRFAPRPSMPNQQQQQQQHSHHQAQHPPGAPGGSGYRPPFPQQQPQHPHQQLPPTSGPPPNPGTFAPPRAPHPDWYDVYNPLIYGDKKHDVNIVTFIVRHDVTLKRIIHEGGAKVICELWDSEVSECRRNIRQAFEHLLKTDLVFCAEHDVEFHIWKICFYQIVEVLKLHSKDESAEVREIVRRNMLQLLDEGLDFYAQMLDTLDQTYKLDLDTYYDVLEPRPTDDRVRCALVSAQKCLLCLGDLARYKENIQDTSNYGMARQYYQKASNIDTRNGRPFNQLAILALTTKRKFEAVYYNMRCLQSKNPFTSSQVRLQLILELQLPT